MSDGTQLENLRAAAKAKLKSEKTKRTLPLQDHILIGLAAFGGVESPQEAIQLGLKLNELMDQKIYTAMCGKTFLKFKHENQYLIDAKGPTHVANHWAFTEQGLKAVREKIGF